MEKLRDSAIEKEDLEWDGKTINAWIQYSPLAGEMMGLASPNQ